MRKRHLNSSSTSHNTFYHLQQCPNGKSISITTHRRTSEGLKCIRKDYIREGAPSKKGVEMIKLEQEGREYQLVSRFEQIIYEHCILKQARERFYTCFVFLFIVLRVGVSQMLSTLTTPSRHQCQPIKLRPAFGGWSPFRCRCDAVIGSKNPSPNQTDPSLLVLPQFWYVIVSQVLILIFFNETTSYGCY